MASNPNPSTNINFVDFQTIVPATWMNNVNNYVNFAQVQNMASLRTLSATQNVAWLVATQGYNNPSDGGAGWYWLDSNNTFNLATPAAPTLTTSTTGGVLAAGVYTYSITAMDESGETLASATSSITTTGSTSTVSITWVPVSGAAGYRIYGRFAGNQQRLFTVVANEGNGVIDDGGVGVNGAPPVVPWHWDNGGTRIQANDGSRWHLSHNSRVNAEQFGANIFSVNTSAIQNAVVAMWALGGGVVGFQAGVYQTGTITMLTNVTLQGVAMDFTGHSFGATPGTSIQLAGGINDNVLYIPLLQHGIRIKDIMIDGNQGGNPSGGNCIACQSNGTNDTNYLGEDSYISIENSTLKNAKQNGFIMGPGQRAAHIRNSYIVLNGGDGVHIFTSDCTIESCLFGDNGAAGINLLGAGVTHITDCDFFGNFNNLQTQDSTFFGGPLPCDRVIVTSCEFDFSVNHGVLIQGSSHGVVFANCTWNTNGQGAGGTASHLFLDTNVFPVSVTNCVFTSDQGSPTTAYDIYMNSGTNVVQAASNQHNAGGVQSSTIAATNAPTQYRLLGGNATYYTDYTGYNSISKLNCVQSNGTSSVIQNTTSTEGGGILFVQGGSNYSASFNTVNSGGANAALAALYLGKSASTSRSINAGGTVNTSGADYAEYMLKAPDCGIVEKGSIVGVNMNGLLTDKFEAAFSFKVKSTNPSFVGSDIYGDVDRDTYDRIAFSGQVPVNVESGKPGDYIIPIANTDGSIGGKAVTTPTFDEYRQAVGQIKSFGADGRAIIFVKVG